MVHFLANPSFAYAQALEAAMMGKDLPPPIQVKPSLAQLKRKVEQVLERVVQYRISSLKFCKELGFDTSREVFLKGENSIILMIELNMEYQLVIFLEMNPLKVEFFDCDQYLTTIDDLVQQLLEVMNIANYE